ncbi:hypothetical protein BGC_59490 [Burkholderia sp. 3C]
MAASATAIADTAERRANQRVRASVALNGNDIGNLVLRELRDAKQMESANERRRGAAPTIVEGAGAGRRSGSG